MFDRPSKTATEITPGVWVLPGQGNAFAVESSDGVVVVDTGPGAGRTERMIAALREVSDSPVTAICYSHGHRGYNFGIPQWLEHNAERGESPPRIIAHRNVPARHARYRETEGYQTLLAEMQFPGLGGKPEPEKVDPTELFDDHMVVCESPRVELLRTPSETDDATSMWLPETRTLFTGPAVPGDFIPNIGTPLRSVRLTGRWAEALEADGEVQLAMHVIDLVALGPDDEPAVVRAREVKSRLCRVRGKQVAPMPSKGLYKSSRLLLEQGSISWQGVGQ